MAAGLSSAVEGAVVDDEDEEKEEEDDEDKGAVELVGLEGGEDEGSGVISPF